jgi:hypothetical protein
LFYLTRMLSEHDFTRSPHHHRRAACHCAGRGRLGRGDHADHQISTLTKRRAFVCQLCGQHIYPCAGTIFHKSPTNLTKWFFTMYLMTSTRHGVAAKEIERQLGVTYKCAWRMCHELRKLMASADFSGPLGGDGKHVEIDETTKGGYQSNRERRAKGSNKTSCSEWSSATACYALARFPIFQRPHWNQSCAAM